MNHLPLADLPTPPEVIDTSSILTRVTCCVSDNPKPEIFNFLNALSRDQFFPHLPKKHLVSFYFETVREIKTFTKGELTNKKEEVSDRSKTYIAENGFK